MWVVVVLHWVTPIIRTNGKNIQENITVGATANGGPEFANGATIGPVQIDNGYTVTVENGAAWNIIGEEDSSTANLWRCPLVISPRDLPSLN